MNDFEKPGSFYLGREFDPHSGQLGDKLLYDAGDLTTHAVCIGMTGSGKTGLCLSLIEEAALDGIPVIAIDPKGDLGNLLLAFPDLRAEDFEPWIDPAAATQQGLSTAELAAKTAATWRKGLADWDQDGERIQRFNAAVEKTIYTPGSSAGVPLTVLQSFHAPATAVIEDTDSYNDLLQSTTQGVLALVGIDADPVQSPAAILIAKVLDHAWREGRNLSLASLIHDIQKPPFTKVGIVDVENFLPAKERMALGMRINNLLASPAFSSWLEGESLDVPSLFYTAEGKPRLSILSISHLSDAERMFFVTVLLNEMLSWIRTQSGTGNLRAILYMDEVFGYFPPTANPPSKRPMLMLLKQARAYGLGVVLATQNPVDLDYKGLANAGTWFLGRLQTERDKLRVLEGLESVAGQASGGFNRQQLDALLSGMRSRVFLVNNVHESGPVVMQTRWAMSYLRGPLTREHIRALTKDRKQETTANELPGNLPITEAFSPATKPVLSSKIVQQFWPIDGNLADGSRLEYRPTVYGRAKLHYSDRSLDIDHWQELAILQPIHGEVGNPVWTSAFAYETLPLLEESGEANAAFAEMPSALAQEKNYRIWGRELKDWLYQSQRHVLWRCPISNIASDHGETEELFRQRVAPLALAAEKERIEREFDDEIEKVQKAIDQAEDAASQHRWWWLGGAWRIFEVLATRLLGGRSRKQLVTATSTKAMSRGRRRYADAQENLEELRENLYRLRHERGQQLADLNTRFRPDSIQLEAIEISPRKSDIDVIGVSLVWVPWQVDDSGQALPLY